MNIQQLEGQSQQARERIEAGLRVTTFPSREEMGRGAADEIISALRERLSRQARVRMVFAAAPSQASTLAALRDASDIDWPRVTAFHMDEYIGLPAGAPQRFGMWLRSHLFDALPFGKVHLMQPGVDPQEEASRYARLMAEAAIDFVCLGIGVNGHIAFNDPPVADFDDPIDVKAVELDDVCRQQQVDDDCFPTFAAVPTHALTLTVPRLMRADRLFCIVPGAAKRWAVEQSLRGPVSTSCPASILRRHPNCAFYLDQESDPEKLA